MEPDQASRDPWQRQVGDFADRSIDSRASHGPMGAVGPQVAPEGVPSSAEMPESCWPAAAAVEVRGTMGLLGARLRCGASPSLIVLRAKPLSSTPPCGVTFPRVT